MRSYSIGRPLRRFAPAVLIAAAVVCAPVRRGAGPPPATLVFTNESLYQANVYVTVPGVSHRRIGTVFGGQTDTLVVPGDLAARGETLNIVARLLARSTPAQSGPVTIRPGEHYLVRLPSDAKILSFLPVYQ